MNIYLFTMKQQMSISIIIFMDDPDYNRTLYYDWKYLVKDTLTNQFIEKRIGRLFKSGIFKKILVQKNSDYFFVLQELRNLMLEQNPETTTFETELTTSTVNNLVLQKLMLLCDINKISYSKIDKNTITDIINTLKWSDTPNHINLGLGLKTLTIFPIIQSANVHIPKDLTQVQQDDIYIVMKTIGKTTADQLLKYTRLDALVTKVCRSINITLKRDSFVLSFVTCTKAFETRNETNYYAEICKMIKVKSLINNQEFMNIIYKKFCELFSVQYPETTDNFAVQIVMTADKDLYDTIILPLNDFILSNKIE